MVTNNLKPIIINYNFLIIMVIILELLSPLIPLPGPMPKFRMSEILIFILALVWFLNLSRQKDPAQSKVNITRFEVYFFLFCLASFISIMWGYLFMGVEYHYRDFMLIPRFILYWGAFRLGLRFSIANPANMKYLKMILLALVLLNIFNFVQYFNVFNFNAIVMPFYSGAETAFKWSSDDPTAGVVKRVIGTANHINNYAFMMIAIVFFCIIFYMQFSANKIKKWDMWFVVISILTLISFFLVKNRTTLISGGFAYLYMGLAMISLRGGIKIKGKSFRQWFVLSLVLIIFALLVGQGLLYRFSTKQTVRLGSNSYLRLSGLQVRAFLWIAAFNRAKLSPIFGYGEQTAERIKNAEISRSVEDGNYSQEAFTNSIIKGEVHELPHNEYLTIWQNFGIAGLSFYLIMFGHVFIKSYKLNDSEYYLFGIGIRTLFVMLAIFNITEVFFYDHQSAIIIMLMIGMIYRLTRIADQSKRGLQTCV